jgi:hypothetical protein
MGWSKKNQPGIARIAMERIDPGIVDLSTVVETEATFAID